MAIKNLIIDNVLIEDASTDGRGVAKYDGRVIFVEGAVPGDTVRVKVFKKEKKFLVAQLDSIIKASDYRVDPKCQHFGICGGCKWQHLSYEAQLIYKAKQVSDALERIGKISTEKINPILGSEKEFFYRNKLDFGASCKRWLTNEEINTGNVFENNVIGFHVPKYFDKIIDIETCLLQNPLINEIRNEIKLYSRNNNISFYDAKTHYGFLRNIIFRTSEATKELMLILIYGIEDDNTLNNLLSFINKKFPQISSFITILNTKLNDSYTDLPFKVWLGKDHLIEKIGEYSFKVGPTSFFQTNSLQTHRLYQLIYDLLPPVNNIVYDLYCGAGTIGIFCSKRINKLIGIEYVAKAIEDAYENKKLNQISNAEFFAGDVAQILSSDFIAFHGKPDILITDPPRAGMDTKVINALMDLETPQIIYVSCNPSTQARDINILSEKYVIDYLQPVDMFPQTTHVENIASLKLKNEI